MTVLQEVKDQLAQMTGSLQGMQRSDGTWRFCFDSGTSVDAYTIIVLRILHHDDEGLIRMLHRRISDAQREDGSWRVYADEPEGNLSATVDAYYALLYSGLSKADDEHMLRAETYIRSRGGLRSVNSMLSKTFLAATGQYPWPVSLLIPLELLLLPPSFPVNLYDFSGYGRVHFIPILVMADRLFVVTRDGAPDLNGLADGRTELYGQAGWHGGSADGQDLREARDERELWEKRERWDRLERRDEREDPESFSARGLESMLETMKKGIGKLTGLPGQLRREARKRAERYMLDRIEPDGTLYSYGTSTLLMILALLALGYDRDHSVIRRAVQGLTEMVCRFPGREKAFLQNTPSTVWDTALLSYGLQEAGLSPASGTIRGASAYLLRKQQAKPGDWIAHLPGIVPGGWGFSDSNTINPDVDDTTAALRAIKRTAADLPEYREAWNRGLHWLLAMQNDDGGWAAFEKNTDKEWLNWLPYDGARSVATDPSTADLTGRTLEFLGKYAGLGGNHPYIRRGMNWLIERQEQDGSWYGRWGICYIYGTWAALTGLCACGAEKDEQAVRKGARWLLSIQNDDGGWGESCTSDRVRQYVPLGASTPSQTAWALDALIAVHDRATPEIDRGVRGLIAALGRRDWTTRYPTGAGLPGLFYSDYNGYNFIWPLIALAHYNNKYGAV